MIKNIKQIILLYLRNPAFSLILGIYLSGAVSSRYFLYKRDFFMSEEAFTFMFLSVICLAYIMGVQIKRQLANYRASLLPHYRKRHLGVSSLWYVLFILTAFLWEKSLPPSIIFTRAGLTGIYLACLCVAVLITWVGYLSLARVFLFLYFAVLILAIQSQSIFHMIDNTPWLNGFFLFLSLVMLLLFGIRMMKLKEGNFEYSYLLTWPPKDLIKSQFAVGPQKPGFLSVIFGDLPAAGEGKTKKYTEKRSMLSRAFHWDYIELAELKLFWIFLALLTPFYLWFVKMANELHLFYNNTYANFLLLSVTPVLIVICGNYRRIVFWGYELLKPVKKEPFILQHGFAMLMNLLLYWFLFILFFSILPGLVLENPFLNELKYWLYLFLTGSYAFVVFAWISYMSSLKSTRLMILNGLVLCLLSLLQFYEAANFPRFIILTNSTVCLLIGGIFIQATYRRWCRAEF